MDQYKINAEKAHFKTFRAIKKTIQSKAPYMDDGGLKQSRRISGHIESNREIRCYGQVFLYIQKGLGVAKDDLKKIIKTIYAIQGREGERKFHLYLASFGGTDLTTPARPYNIFSYKSGIINTVEELVGYEKSASSMFLNTLDLNIKKPTKISRKDLVLIIADSRKKLYISNDVKTQLLKHKHTYVLLVGKEIMGEAFNRIDFN